MYEYRQVSALGGGLSDKDLCITSIFSVKLAVRSSAEMEEEVLNEEKG